MSFDTVQLREIRSRYTEMRVLPVGTQSEMEDE